MAAVAVITPTWQRDSQIVARAVGSVRAQTLKDHEHYLAGDGALSPAVVRLGEEERAAGNQALQVLVTGRHYGDYGYGVRNEVLSGLSGTSEYVCFLDDDNVLLPGFLEVMVRALNRRPDAGMAVCQCWHFGPLPARWDRPPCVLNGHPVCVGNIDLVQVVVRRAALQALGGFHLHGVQGYLSDGYTLGLLAERQPVVYVDELLALHL